MRARQDCCFEADKEVLSLTDGLKFVQAVAVKYVDSPVRSNTDYLLLRGKESYFHALEAWVSFFGIDNFLSVGINDDETTIITSDSHETNLLRAIKTSDGSVLVRLSVLVGVHKGEMEAERVKKLYSAVESSNN